MAQLQPDRSRSRRGWLLVFLIGTSVLRAEDLSEYYGFGAMEILKLDWELGAPLAEDLNGDSLNDLIVCNNRKARIELLLQRHDFDPQVVPVTAAAVSENVNDLFGREAGWRFKRFQYPLHVKATSLVVGDFNHDGRPDLAYYSAEGLYVVLQDRDEDADATKRRGQDALATTLREPTWQAATRFDLRDGLRTSEALVAGDLNGDGRTDLILLLQDGYYTLLQDAEGRLARPVRHYSAAGNLRQVEIGDLNGDGRSDLVLLTAEQQEYPLRIRLQDSDGVLGPEGRYAMPVPHVLRLCALDDTGRQVIASVSRPSGRFALHAMVREDQTRPTVSIHPLPSGDDIAKRDMTTADIDADGLTDMIVTDPGRGQFLVFRGQAGSGLGPATAYPGLKDMRKVCAARLGDHPGDTLAVLSVDEKLIALTRFEGGRLQFPQAVAVVGEPQAMELADLDGDGRLDLAYVAKGPDPAQAFFFRSVLDIGRETSRPGPSLPLTRLEDRPQDLLACDIDHDGDTDLIVVRSYDPLLLVRQTQAGVFEPQAQDQTHSGLVGNMASCSLCLAPLGKEGGPALLLARGEFARSLYFDADRGWQVIDQYQTGDGRRQIRVAAAVPRADGGTPSIVGYDDVSGAAFFLDPQADGTYRMSREIDVGVAKVRKILTGSFGGSTQDLVLCAERELICLRTDAQWELRQIAGFEPSIEGGSFGPFAVGDVNSDVTPDFVVCEQGRYHLQILSFDASARLADACKFRVFEAHPRSAADRQQGRAANSGEPRHLLIRDVTGDGRNDLVLLVHDRIILYPQDATD